MIPGLEKAVSGLTGIVCTVSRDEDGLLWFSPEAPSIIQLSELALNPELARPHLRTQIAQYGRLLAELENGRYEGTLEDLKLLGRQLDSYFSVFLLLHNTYEGILHRAAVLLAREMSSNEVDYVMSRIMTCALTTWLADKRIALRNKKDLFEVTSIAPMPPFTLLEDLQKTAQQLRGLMEDMPAIGMGTRRFLEYAVDTFVVKEWKFVMNKLIFTRFSRVARGLATRRQDYLRRVENWETHSFGSLLKLLES